MNLSASRYQKLIPYSIVIIISTLFFILGSIYPCEIHSDSTMQIKSVQQWLRGEAGLFNAVVLPSHRDLSQNVEAWIVLWSPGMAAFFLPLLALGLSLGFAARLIAYSMFILGCLGWIKVADTIKVNFPTRVILAITLSTYAFTIGGVNLFVSDVLPFGIMPWLFLYTLHFTLNLNSRKRPYIQAFFHSCILGFLFGVAYWVKHSALLASLGLFSYLALYLLFFNRSYALSKRLFLLTACLVFLLLPVIMLILLNKYLAGINYFAAQIMGHPGLLSDFAIYSKPFYVKLFYLSSSFLGAIGLALFQGWLWLMHIIYFSDRLLPIFSSLGFHQRIIPFTISGIPGALVVAWLLVYSRMIYNKIIFVFGCCITLVPFISLLYAMNRMRLNCLIFDNYRYAPSFFIFTEILIISSFCHFISHNNKFIAKIFTFFILFIFFIVPNAFLLANFVKNGICERIGHRYIATENHLFEPTLSKTNAKSVVDNIESLIKSHRDTVVLATIDYNGCSSQSWLEMKQRALPLGYASAHLLHTHGTEGVNIAGSQPFLTTEKLRVILVISKTLENDGKTLLKIKERFPQASEWLHLPDEAGSDSLVSIWYADLTQ